MNAPSHVDRSSKDSVPSPSVRLFVAFLGARAAFGLAYLIGSIRRLPIPWYYPLERRFSFESTPSGFAMEWYGRTAVSLLAALAAFALLFAATKRGPLRRALSRRSTVLAIARAGALILLVDFAYFGWILMHQTPRPLPLPGARSLGEEIFYLGPQRGGRTGVSSSG